jgi:hypothetical protein
VLSGSFQSWDFFYSSKFLPSPPGSNSHFRFFLILFLCFYLTSLLLTLCSPPNFTFLLTHAIRSHSEHSHHSVITSGMRTRPIFAWRHDLDRSLLTRDNLKQVNRMWSEQACPRNGPSLLVHFTDRIFKANTSIRCPLPWQLRLLTAATECDV